MLTVAKALRVLKLLEQQHQKLARIIRSQDESQQDIFLDENKSTEPLTATTDPTTPTTSPREKTASPKSKSTTSAIASARVGSQARESSPSLARDIASRRGIPASGRNPPSAAAQARARQLSPESRRRAKTSGASKAPPSMVDSQINLQQSRRTQRAEDDEGFAKFYSNLTTGTMSKLSSVLAYAGLPLAADDIQPDQESNHKPEKRTVRAGNDPDVKKIFSKAALDAIEDEHRRRGTLGHGFGPAESFYVVQKGGGTYSYADIAKAQQNQLAGIDEEDDDAFVDAKEVAGPPSPKQSRSSHQKRTSFGNPRTQEELELENTTLKQTLEQVAGRLANFEAHAQDASMAALTQSLVNLRPQVGGEAALQERLRQLEREVEQQAEDKQKLESVAAKQEKILKKYHVKWEEIKKSARERDKVKKEKAVKGIDSSFVDASEGIA